MTQQEWDDGITRIDFRMWEDETIYFEIESGASPWVFGSTVTVGDA